MIQDQVLCVCLICPFLLMCLCFIKQEKYKYNLISIAMPEQQENV